MTVIDLASTLAGTFSEDELLAACASLGVRRPLGLAGAGAHPLGPVSVSDTTAAALAALAAPEAIAVVERFAAGVKRVTYVAVRGPWAAVHRMHGDHHTIEALDAEDASAELLATAGLDTPAVLSWSSNPDNTHGGTTTRAPVDVTRGAFDRMSELVAEHDLARGAAALEADGVAAGTAASLVAGAHHDSVHVLGLRSLGLRYEGCELAWIGDDARWLVPLPARSAERAAVIGHFVGPRHLRVQIEPVTEASLAAELAMLFG